MVASLHGHVFVVIAHSYHPVVASTACRLHHRVFRIFVVDVRATQCLIFIVVDNVVSVVVRLCVVSCVELCIVAVCRRNA